MKVEGEILKLTRLCMLHEMSVNMTDPRTETGKEAYYNGPLLGLTGKYAGSYENTGLVTLEAVSVMGGMCSPEIPTTNASPIGCPFLPYPVICTTIWPERRAEYLADFRRRE